jgi:hypothetical protein
VAFCFVIVCVAAGCGRKAGKTPAAKATPPAGVGLPDWAPKNPSPEFLRAAKVLKPLPEDAGGGGSPLTVAFYEMFGALTDQQIATFLERKQGKVGPDTPDSARALFKEKYGAKEVGGELVYSRNEVSVPFKSLTPAQRRAFERVQAVWSEAMKAEDNEDLLIKLYKIGAKENLSNVDIAFMATGHEVNFLMVVTKKKSGNRVESACLGTGFAQL